MGQNTADFFGPNGGNPLPDPREEYRRRKKLCESRKRGLERESLHLSRARMGIFLAGVLLVAVLVLFGGNEAWLLLPAGIFVVLVAAHRRVEGRLGRLRQSCRYFRTALERVEGRAPTQPAGERWLDPAHPYAEHLDLFGAGSLYQRLCTARTLAGQETLAGWLLHPASPAEIEGRQEAVDELRGECDLREEMDRVCERAAAGVDPATLHGWAARSSPRPPFLPRGIAALLAVLNLASLGLWLVFRLSPLFFLASIGISWWFEQRALRQGEPLLASIEGVAGQLSTLSRVLKYIENYRYKAPLLCALQEELQKGALAADPPSGRIRSLRRRLEWLDSARNLLFAPLAFLLLWKAQWGWSVQAWTARHQPALDPWLRCAGSFEALVSLSAYAFEHPEDVRPEFTTAGGLAGEGLGHPLLSGLSCVRNDLRLDDQLRLYLISGSNMSGKSTLLRTVGLNVVLAQAGAVVRARRLRLSSLAVGASLRIVDSLPAGLSHFYAEVRRLRRLRELTREETPALLLLDELFHGTNSHDRRVGAQALLRHFVRDGAFILVTTHDLALTRLADELGSVARNVHFEDQVEEGRMVFDYRLRPGVAGKGNALRILAAEGLLEDEEVESPELEGEDRV